MKIILEAEKSKVMKNRFIAILKTYKSVVWNLLENFRLFWGKMHLIL